MTWAEIKRTAAIAAKNTGQQLDGSSGHRAQFEAACEVLDTQLQDLLSSHGRAPSASTLRQPGVRSSHAAGGSSGLHAAGTQMLVGDDPAHTPALHSAHTGVSTSQHACERALGHLSRLAIQPASNVFLESSLHSVNPAGSELVRQLHSLMSAKQYAAALAILLKPHLLTARLKRQGTAELLTNDADVNPEITPFAESDMMLKAVGIQLQVWANRELTALHLDARLESIHEKLLDHAFNRPPARGTSTWWRLLVPAVTLELHPDGLHQLHIASIEETHTMAAALFHLASGSRAAWSALARVFWHGLACPSVLTDAGFSVSSHHTQKRWSPLSFSRRFQTLESQAQGILSSLQEAVPSNPDHDTRRMQGTHHLLELAENSRALLPRTFLQMVGQKVLFHATQQLPVLSSLPEDLPEAVLQALFTQPFAEAVEMAVQTVSDPSVDAAAFVDAKPTANSVRKYVSLQASRQTSANQHHAGSTSINSTTSQPSEGNTSQPRYSSSAVPPVHADHHAATADVVAGNAKTAFTSILNVFKDVQGFQSGMLFIFETAAASRTLGKTPPCSSPVAIVPVLGAGVGEGEEVHHGAEGWSAKALLRRYQAVVDRDLGRVWIAQKALLATIIRQGLTREVQSILSKEDPNSLLWVALNASTWPPAEPSLSAYLAPDSNASSTPPKQPSGHGHGHSKQHAAAAAALAPTEDLERPTLIDRGSHKVLVLVNFHLQKIDKYPAVVQHLLSSSLLECLSLLMDWLSRTAVPLHDGSVLQPASMILMHSAATCIRRRLACFRRGLDLAVRDEGYQQVLLQYANCVIQADCLATSLQQHILSSYKICINLTILASARTADWRSFRAPARRAATAGPALRVWRCALHRLLHYSCQMGSLLSIEVLLSQVVLESLGSICQLYLGLSPSPQRLPQFVADVTLVVSACFKLCQPVQMTGHRHYTLAEGLDAPDGKPAQGQMSGMASGELSSPRALSKDPVDVATLLPRVYSMPGDAQRVLSSMCQRLATRAALLWCSPQELAEAMGLAPRAPPSVSAAEAPHTPSDPTPEAAGASSSSPERISQQGAAEGGYSHQGVLRAGEAALLFMHTISRGRTFDGPTEQGQQGYSDTAAAGIGATSPTLDSTTAMAPKATVAGPVAEGREEDASTGASIGEASSGGAAAAAAAQTRMAHNTQGSMVETQQLPAPTAPTRVGGGLLPHGVGESSHGVGESSHGGHMEQQWRLPQLPHDPATTTTTTATTAAATASVSSTFAGLVALHIPDDHHQQQQQHKPKSDVGKSGRPGDAESCWDWVDGQLQAFLKSNGIVLTLSFDPTEALQPTEDHMAGPEGDLWRGMLLALVAVADAGTANAAAVLRHELHAQVQGLPYSVEELAGRLAVQRLAACVGAV
ncbi:MAG: hypothetical protein WDW38_004145 [Sanguina aurantia]